MGLLVQVEVAIRAPDGTPQAGATRTEFTVIPAGNYANEADLAVATAETLASDAVGRIREQMVDWASYMTALNQPKGASSG